MENLITDRATFVSELGKLIARTDIIACGGSVEAHLEKDKETGEKTDNVTGMYAKMSVKLPGVTGVTLDGETFYSKNTAVNISAFKLSNSQAETVAKPAAKAATISASALRERLAQLNNSQTAQAAN
jgi:hypothetical protein